MKMGVSHPFTYRSGISNTGITGTPSLSVDDWQEGQVVDSGFNR